MSGLAARTGARARLSLPALPPRLGRWMAGIAAVCALLAATYFLWLRDSSFVQIDNVTITGLTSDDADNIRAAIEGKAGEMTTLHVRVGELERVVEGFPVVRSLQVRTDFPHGLRVHVFEHHPAALVDGGDTRVPVASDGSVLRGLPVKGPLPIVNLEGALPPDQVRGAGRLALFGVAGAAPAALVPRMEEVHIDRERGVVVTLEEGPELVFGDAGRAREKWTAAARVLADEATEGASYVDVRLPERPAAGGITASVNPQL